MGKTTIEWTERTWNCLRGCSRISQGCVHCYAETIAKRFRDSTFEGFANARGWTGRVKLLEHKLEEPLSWTKPSKIFVNSMSDFFHEDLADEARDRMLAVMLLSPRHTFQVLTKRSSKMLSYLSDDRLYHRVLSAADEIREYRPELMRVGISSPKRLPPPWIWWGVSVEDEDSADDRLFDLVRTPAGVRFVSAEPLLERIDIRQWLEHVYCPKCGESVHNEDFAPNDCCETLARPAIDWVIIGGESGPGARPFDVEWARVLLRQCRMTGVKAFMKQIGSNASDPINGFASPSVKVDPQLVTLTGRYKSKKGGDWDEWPKELRVREFPREECV